MNKKVLCGVAAVLVSAALAGAETNGCFVVEVGTPAGWVEVARPEFSEFLGLASVDLSEYVDSSVATRVRLRREGGAAAHLDSLLLGGSPPAAAGDGTGGLWKLARRDWDVLDAAEGAVEVSFPTGAGGELQIAGRIEAERISEIPFQFPAANLYTEIGSDSEFLSYRLDSAATPAQAEPLFSLYCVTGSGHPWGYTHGWVWNDARNLYARLDFTPDNTCDGEKDYASVHVRTTRGCGSSG